MTTYDGVLLYAGEDHQFAAWVVERLTRRDFKIWWDKYFLPGGEFSLKHMAEVMSSTGHVVLLWSRASTSSDWVRAELALARSLDKKVIPCLVGDSPPLPVWLQAVASVDFRRDRDEAFEQLTRALEPGQVKEPTAALRSIAATSFLPMLLLLFVLAAAALSLPTIVGAATSLGGSVSTLGSPLSTFGSWILQNSTRAIVPLIALSLLLSAVRLTLEYLAAWRVARHFGPPPTENRRAKHAVDLELD